MTWILSSLSIHGVKGVLDRAGEFNLKPKNDKPKSIALFGRNGQGKSGYADAVEYLFSLDGEVEHLGKGPADSEQGGKHAIPHVLAKEKKVGSKVSAQFVHLKTGERLSVERPVVTGRNDFRPKEIETIVSQAPAHRILRQHDLRRFVVDMTPGAKFNEFARWVGLESATKLLGHLTTTEHKLKETDVDREISERLKSIAKHTAGTIQAYDLKAIFDYCRREAIKLTQQPIAIKTISDIDTAIQVLSSHREALLIRSQKAYAHVTQNNLEQILKDFTSEERGSLYKLQTSLDSLIQAEHYRDEVQNKTAQNIFQEVWKNAREVIEKEKPEVCPVCQTPWENTTVGSVEHVLVVLQESLSSLQQFRAVEGAYSHQCQDLKSKLQTIETALNQIVSLSKKLGLQQVSEATLTLQSACHDLKEIPANIQPLRSRFAEFINHCSILCTQLIPQALATHKIQEDMSASTTPIDQSITRLQGIKETIGRLEALQQQKVALRTIEQQFGRVADTIRNQIKALTENAVNALRADVESIYKKIHPGEAIPNVFIDLDADKKTLAVRVNFHSSERRVPPGGYLSEAQINTLGLALFLSSVRLFNKNFPFVFLDDIVSSYDADNRARIVDVIAEYMNGFQIFLTTHDERFYAHLKQRLETENWLFERIVGYDFEKGPRRESDNLRPAEIEQLIADGNPQIAGNAVRQFMEEWFDKMCDKYAVFTLHRRGTRAYQRTLSDFLQPFLGRVQNLGAGFGTYFLNSAAYQKLKGCMLINYYSHYQANPYEWPAIGDVECIWEAFQEFTKLFYCYTCEKQLKYDSSDGRLYCTCGGTILPPTA